MEAGRFIACGRKHGVSEDGGRHNFICSSEIGSAMMLNAAGDYKRNTAGKNRPESREPGYTMAQACYCTRAARDVAATQANYY